MRRIVSVIALLMVSAWPNILLAKEQFDTHHPFLYVSVPLAAVSKPNQPLAELGFAIRQSNGLMTTYSDSSRQLPLVNLTFTSQGLRSWSAFGIDVTKLSANVDSASEAENLPAVNPAVWVGAILLGAALIAEAKSDYERATRIDPWPAPPNNISVSLPPLPPPSTSPPSSATWR